MPIKQRKTTSVLLILRFTNNITKTLQKMKFKVNRRQVCYIMVKQYDNQLMRRWPTSDEREKKCRIFSIN